MTPQPNIPTPRTDKLDGFEPSNGAMIVCCNGTGDYIKREDYRQLERELTQANEVSKGEFNRATYWEKKCLEAESQLTQWREDAERLAVCINEIKSAVDFEFGGWGDESLLAKEHYIYKTNDALTTHNKLMEQMKEKKV